MTTNITPEQARELLDGTTPRPWKIVAYGISCPELMIETFDGDTLAAEVEPDDAPLIAAAPALAQTVANLHYEYAVQLEDTTGETRFAMSMYNLTRNPEEAWWAPTPNAPLANHWRFSQTGLKVRIVRRLVSDPEVVE